MLEDGSVFQPHLRVAYNDYTVPGLPPHSVGVLRVEGVITEDTLDIFIECKLQDGALRSRAAQGPDQGTRMEVISLFPEYESFVLPGRSFQSSPDDLPSNTVNDDVKNVV